MYKYIFSLNPKRDWTSRRISLGHNLRLVAVTLLIATIITGLWYECRAHEWPFLISDEGDLLMLNTSILVCAAIFAVIAALLFTETWQRTSKISAIVLRKDKDAFLILRDEKIPIRMHLVLGFFAASIIVQFGMADYSEARIGAFFVFLISTVITIYFIATLETQNFSNSAWFRKHIPPDWFKVEVETFFEEQTKKTKAIDS